MEKSKKNGRERETPFLEDLADTIMLMVVIYRGGRGEVKRNGM